MSKVPLSFILLLVLANVCQFAFILYQQKSFNESVLEIQEENRLLEDKVLALHSELDQVKSSTIKGMLGSANDAVSEKLGSVYDVVKNKIDEIKDDSSEE